MDNEKQRTVILVDLKSIDTRVKRMLDAYEEFKKACNEIAPCFQSGNIEFVIRQAKDAEKVKSSAAQSLERMMDLRVRKILEQLENEEKRIIPNKKHIRNLYMGLHAVALLKLKAI